MGKERRGQKQQRCSTFRTAASSSAHPQHAETSTIHWRGGERGQHFERLMSVIDCYFQEFLHAKFSHVETDTVRG